MTRLDEALAAAARRWDYRSGVTCCQTCGGHGTVQALHRPTINDPYPERACPDCDGEPHYPECPVCGFGTELSGFDCIVCETVAAIRDEDLPRVEFADLVHAFGHALKARRAAA